VVAVLGRKILLRRRADGGWTALELACRHQNADLSAVPRDGDELVCPRHGWRYHPRSGHCLNEPWASLRRFAVREADGEIWLSIAPEPSSET
jgi:3-phenylpropionate/trans-cinnamate dioxygenase ferredoxin subunit